jgi:hypothetical protein
MRLSRFVTVYHVTFTVNACRLPYQNLSSPLKESRKVKWITSYNTTIINSMSNETTDVTRNPTSIIGEERSPITWRRRNADVAGRFAHRGTTWTERWQVNSVMQARTGQARTKGNPNGIGKPGSSRVQTAIGVHRALRHSVTARNQTHKSKSIDDRTDRQKSHLIII